MDGTDKCSDWHEIPKRDTGCFKIHDSSRSHAAASSVKRCYSLVSSITLTAHQAIFLSLYDLAWDRSTDHKVSKDWQNKTLFCKNNKSFSKNKKKHLALLSNQILYTYIQCKRVFIPLPPKSHSHYCNAEKDYFD